MVGLRSYTFRWTPSDHARVTSLLVREQFSSGVWRVLKWGVVGVVVLAGLVTVASIVMGQGRSVLPLGTLTLVVGSMVAAFGQLTGWIRAWQVRSLDPNVKHPITQTLDDVGVHVLLRTANIDLKWTGIHKVRETADMFLFYYNRRWAYFLPKRCIETVGEVSDLRSWIRERLPATVPYQHT
jgi:YcxB-like protein